MVSYSRWVVLLLSVALLIRAGVGAFAYFAPEIAATEFELDLGDSGHGRYMLMVFGMRDMAIVLALLLAPRGFLKTLIALCIAIELSDLTAATLTYADGEFTAAQWRGQLAVIFGALIPETIALALAQREDGLRAGRAASA